MPKTTNKTVPTDAGVLDFLVALSNREQRADSEILIGMMQEISGKPPVMWGASIIGFGLHHYKYASGREGDEPVLGFSPRKGKLALYITNDATKYPEIRERLGKHKTGKACIYVTRLGDVDGDALKDLIRAGYADTMKSMSSAS